ncbi:hypothetical protein Vretimale_12291 [Volvox reticuliferus]|uniref:Uncharacterized protein n=1 Tax=Volvox reticuliferus TaxID=1737510 RepID=A0A8J4FM46_9CHLO|nr:hypothetical protein Vretifemale_8897 [Volvox reticuliferus]GIM08192.1 hypothetical protein Vretimale_12291 [Volvox reticuliferus]
MSGRPPPALLALAASQPPGDTAAEQLPQPSSSNETQDTVGQPEQALSAAPKSILKTADSLRSNYGYQRNISWQDQYGKSLTQVVEFEPSEHADSDYDDFEERSCCILM